VVHLKCGAADLLAAALLRHTRIKMQTQRFVLNRDSVVEFRFWSGKVRWWVEKLGTESGPRYFHISHPLGLRGLELGLHCHFSTESLLRKLQASVDRGVPSNAATFRKPGKVTNENEIDHTSKVWHCVHWTHTHHRAQHPSTVINALPRY
jgi:hypothetical protein